MTWRTVKSGALLSFVTSGSRGWAKYYDESGAAFLRMGNLNHDSVSLDLRDVQRVRPPAGTEGIRTKVQASDILISITADVGMVGLVPPEFDEAYINQHVALARPIAAIHPSYLAWFLASPLAQRQFRALQRGATKLGLGLDDIRAVDVPVPAVDEQRRIVGEIEKQLTRLESGVSALRRVQAKLKRYRAAVLKAACEGRLVPTEAELARRDGRAYETGKQLLARILTKRRQNWSGRGSYREPSGPDAASLSTLPRGWCRATLDALLREPLRNGYSAKAIRTGGGLRAFTLSAVTEGDFSERNTKLTVADPERVKDLWAEPGDIYVERSNTPELVGIARLYNGPSRYAFIPDLFIRVRLSTISTRFIEISLLSERVRRFLRSHAQGIAGTMPKIDQAAVEGAPIALPPLAEQTRIVAEVERRLSVIEELEAVVVANLQRAARLRQSILERAFSGRLVSDDGAPHPGAEPRRL